MRRSIAAAAVLATMTALSALSPALAADPNGQSNSQSNEMEGWKGPEQPVAPGQEAMASLKLALKAGSTSGAAGKAIAAANARKAAAAADGGMTAAATTYTAYTVGTYERQQTTYYYCGPAAIQDMSDYAWKKGATGVKYSQKTISDKWTHTGTAGTGAAAELKGANGVLVGSPQADFPYWSYQPTDGEDWSTTLLNDTVVGMPQLVNLQPWWKSSGGTWYYLPSWADHTSTGGHWVLANGWEGLYDGTGGPRVRYDDGSAPYGGGTGTWWVDQYDMWQLIRHHNNVVIW